MNNDIIVPGKVWFQHLGYIFSKAPGTGRPQEVEEVAGNLQNVPAPGGVEMDVLASRAGFAEQPGEQKYQDRRWEVLTVRCLLQWGLSLISGPGGLALPKVKAWCQSSAGRKSPISIHDLGGPQSPSFGLPEIMRVLLTVGSDNRLVYSYYITKDSKLIVLSRVHEFHSVSFLEGFNAYQMTTNKWYSIYCKNHAWNNTLLTGLKQTVTQTSKLWTYIYIYNIKIKIKVISKLYITNYV